MTDLEERVFNYIRRAVCGRHLTPTRDRIAAMTGLRGRDVTLCVRSLENAGAIEARRNNRDCIRQFGVEVKGEMRWTRVRETKRGRQGPSVTEYGGGEIARMPDRLEAERLIAELYQGRTY